MYVHFLHVYMIHILFIDVFMYVHKCVYVLCVCMYVYIYILYAQSHMDPMGTVSTQVCLNSWGSHWGEGGAINVGLLGLFGKQGAHGA